jgi:transcriptional regulator with XRE-family HTH domain
MPRQTRPPKGPLAQRLDQLFRTVHPKDRGPYTPAEVADAINAEARERVVSATYLWLLRTGERDNPTLRHLTAIAKFFGVPPVYFLPDTEADQGTLPGEVLAALTDDKVRGPREPAARQPIPRSSSRRTATRPLRRSESAPTARSGTTASHTRSMLTRSSESGAVWISANDRAYAAGCAPRDPAVRLTAGAPRDPGATATTRPDRANARWSHPMARADQADAARAAIFARLERRVDPEGILSATERAPLIRAAARRLSATLNSARSRK